MSGTDGVWMTYEEFLSSRLSDLLRFAVVLCGERMRAEDVVQEVLIRTQQHWDRISTADSPYAYVRTMIVNENLAWHRKWSRQVPSDDLERTRTRGGTSGLGREVEPDHADVVVDRDDLVNRLNGLSAQQRTAVVLRYFADLSHAEIAADLGCSEGTARGYLSRALATLRVQLDHDRDSDRELTRRDA